jgi:hypothetical protein
MIERLFAKGLVAILFVLLMVDELDKWWEEHRHHRHCSHG